MGDDEATRRAAEHKAAALHRLGWEEGAGTTIWARAVQDNLELHESARKRFAANDADLESWERLHATALTLVVAIDQVLAFERRVRRLTGDAELARARDRFDAVRPDAEALRDLVAHLDAYAVGEGKRQRGEGKPPAISQKYVSMLISWSDAEGTTVNVGMEQLNLQMAAKAAIELARVVERVRVDHLKRAGHEANAALRRQYGLAPD
jgi:hypothetical protein